MRMLSAAQWLRERDMREREQDNDYAQARITTSSCKVAGTNPPPKHADRSCSPAADEQACMLQSPLG